MPLKSDSSEDGLWVNDYVKPGDPGVYALIIGVSRYDHLAGGEKPAGETYGLGQLAVSALTALRFFAWLRGTYALDGWPVARVRLLLSPLRAGVGSSRVDELQGADPKVVAHAGEATFGNCKDAIANWYGEMKDLPKSAKGRSLFFFSGHGMQLGWENQLLLPSDYGRPRGSNDEVIRTRNLFECLTSLPSVASHVVLLDACRNDIDKLRRVKGTNVIDESGLLGDPLVELRVLRAAASGLYAYQPTTAGGMSLFGQALLDGLTAQPNPLLDEAPIELSARGQVRTVEFEKLLPYMNGRIQKLIKAANADIDQVVRADGGGTVSGRLELTELASPVAGPASPGDEKDVEEIELESASPRTVAPRPGAWFEDRYRERREVPREANQSGGLHDYLGSEAFTDRWLTSARAVGLSTGIEHDHTRIQIRAAAQSTPADARRPRGRAEFARGPAPRSSRRFHPRSDRPRLRHHRFFGSFLLDDPSRGSDDAPVSDRN